MESKSAKFFVRLLIYPLTLFSAYRNYNLIQTTLSGSTFAYAAGLFALFALDAGVIIWTEIAFRVDSDTQDHIAKGMVIADLVGALLGVVADTMLYVDRAQFIETITIVSVYGVAAAIFLNLGAGFVYFLSDPENELRMDERRINREIRKKEKQAELEMKAALRDVDSARIMRDAAAIRNATAVAALGVSQPEPSQNGDGKLAVAMHAEGAEVPAPKGRKAKN